MKALRLSLCTDETTWLNPHLEPLVADWRDAGHEVVHVHDPAAIPAGDVCFLLSLSRIVPASVRARNTHTLVVHGSDLPRGRGWSPMSWQVLEGASEIPMTLFEAEDGVDSGVIYLQEHFALDGTELVEELRALVAASTVRLCRRFAAEYPGVVTGARAQAGEPSFYARRRPEDSRLDPELSLREQLNLLRVVDNKRYPAFFDVDGQRYYLQITKHHPSEEG